MNTEVEIVPKEEAGTADTEINSATVTYKKTPHPLVCGVFTPAQSSIGKDHCFTLRQQIRLNVFLSEKQLAEVLVGILLALITKIR